MPLNIKVTWRGAVASSKRLMGLDDRTTLAELKAIITNESGIDSGCMQLKAGFPPQDVSGSETDPVVKLGITSGSALTVLERKETAAPAAQLPATGAAASPSPAAALPSAAPASRTAFSSHARLPQPPPQPQSGGELHEMLRSLVDMGFPEAQAARALKAAGGDMITAVEMCMGGDPSAFASQTAPAAPVAPPSVIIRRIIDADNSCLFNAVGYALRRKRKVGSELRLMITEAVRGSPDVYNEGILGKSPEEYCKWILDTKSWGGEIELSILSKKLAVMITVVDIQTNNAYSYGEEGGFVKRIFVIYDGVHYDALAQASDESAPESDDVTVFDPSAPGKELEMAKALAADLKSRNQFIDMGACDLKCMVCLKLLEGQKGALEHARATGHQNFGQI